ncbi:putative glycosyltransferase [Cellulophaga phage phi18:2]|uniref:Putative glycosyltransferase n=2 Tax=Cellulophaga phage phi18:1 TaxID=1327982 RepID=S0A439_9CAUD|nr:glycosyltransferase [Cellulophaga phage phi18:1]AGO48488.1 putative glycosyltransferase [Cellulophaga phage phi18:1]AGO49202.1 putative glycosyltransferase [Cellulophaga phage phi18:2]
MGQRRLIYTVNIGGYDSVLPIKNKEKDVDYVLFTDNKKEKVSGWRSVFVANKGDNQRQSREIKINVHKFIDNFDVCLYIDASYVIRRPLTAYIDRFFNGGALFHKHGSRSCLFDEAEVVIEKKIDTFENIAPQMRKYSAAGMPKQFGLTQNGFFIRDRSMDKFFELWYDEIRSGSYRDQLSLPWIVYKYSGKYKVKSIDPIAFQSYLVNGPHVKKRQTASRGKMSTPKVWYFTPGRGDKNLGQAYNDHCELVPDGDWICIMDGDVLFLNPFWSKQIEDIIIKHGNKYPLISCLTNRLGLEYQLPYGFSEDPNILNHAEIADRHFEEFYDVVDPSPKPTAGLFMLFPKTTWDIVKFQPGLASGEVFVDWAFSSTVMKKLGKLGIAKGLYLFHFYRFNRKHKRDINHLL